MLEAMRKRLEKDEEGFTLIELMVVVLIIGILVAIAVPTFLNAQDNAKSKAAQSNARSALSAAKTVFADKEAYYSVAIADLQAAEPSLAWQAAAAASGNVEQISWKVAASPANVFYIAVKAKNNDCFFIRDDTDPTSATRGTYYGKSRAAATCDVDDAPATHAYDLSQSVGWAK